MIDYVDPVTKGKLKLSADKFITEEGKIYEYKAQIPRFVSEVNYADSFGFQWNTYTRTQLDSHNSYIISEQRLRDMLGAHLDHLEGKNVLEVGCGAGRFTEILLKYGANVHATDLSKAVEANFRNFQTHTNYRVAQADINQLPFPYASFDLVLCIGVIQHTHNPQESLDNLYKYVKPGGILAYDQYMWSLFYLTKPVLPIRFILKRLKPERAFKIVNHLVSVFFPLQWKFRNHRILTMILNRFSPLYTYFDKFNDLSYDQHHELTKLDTFDGLTDYYKHLTTINKTIKHLRKLKFSKLTVKEGGNGVEIVAIK